MKIRKVYQGGKAYQQATWLGEDNSLHCDTREVTMQEQQERAEKTLPVRLYNRTLGMDRDVLSSAVFRVGRGAREQLDVTLQSVRGTQLRYRGPELRQDDARVLEFLVHAVRRGYATAAISFDALEFVEHIGWDRHKRSVEKLEDCLDRMQGARLNIARGAAFVSVQLVAKVGGEGQQRTVQLHSEITHLFEGSVTFVPLEERRALSDGIPSWLAGFLYANDDEDLFEIADLHKHSGSGGKVGKFQENLREAAVKLEKLKAVQRIEFPRGKLRVYRFPR